MELTIGSLWNPADQQAAVRLMQAGQPCGIFARAVCGIWGDAAHPEFPAAIYRLKGERRGQCPLATTLPAAALVPLLDLARIAPPLHPILLDPGELSACLGSLCFIRLPVTAAAAATLPAVVVSRLADGTPIIQNWDPAGHPAMAATIRELGAQGVRWPAATSMNVSGQPEIVDQAEGIAFARQTGMSYFLTDPQDQGRVRGSYTILQVDRTGAWLVRDGNIPGYLFDRLLPVPLSPAEPIPAKFPRQDFRWLLDSDLPPAAIRQAILDFIVTGERCPQL